MGYVIQPNSESLLGLLTFGIGYFWLYPYINLSIANFYENLRIGQEKGLI